MSVKALTPEQQKLVEDNHNLIYFMLRKRGLDVEDYYGIAAIGLCKAALKYQNQKVPFTTFACLKIKKEIYTEFRSQNAAMRSSCTTVSMEHELGGNDTDLTIADTLMTTETPETLAYANDILYAVDSLPKKQREIVRLTLYGFRQKEIGELHGSTRQNINLLLNGARKNLVAVGIG